MVAIAACFSQCSIGLSTASSEYCKPNDRWRNPSSFYRVKETHLVLLAYLERLKLNNSPTILARSQLSLYSFLLSYERMPRTPFLDKSTDAQERFSHLLYWVPLLHYDTGCFYGMFFPPPRNWMIFMLPPTLSCAMIIFKIFYIKNYLAQLWKRPCNCVWDCS